MVLVRALIDDISCIIFFATPINFNNLSTSILNDAGKMVYAEGIDTADYSVDQLLKIQEYAETLKEEQKCSEQ